METNTDEDKGMDNAVHDFKVNDGERVLQFKGRYLGFASTENRGGDRWIEFTIYRTAGSGKYVLTRVGRSIRFHLPDCYALENQDSIKPVPIATMPESARSCMKCMPDGDDHLEDNDLVYQEQTRNWASVFDTANDLIRGLMQLSDNGTYFLTNVAKEAIEVAAGNDKTLSDAYYVVEVV